MAYIISQIVICLLLAVAIGFLIGWFLSKAVKKEKENLYIESLKQDLRDKDDEWYRLKAELVQTQKREKALERELKNKEKDFQLIGELKEEIKNLHTIIDSKDNEIEVLKKELSEKERIKEKLEEEDEKLKELQDKVETLNKEKKDLEKELEIIQRKLDECKNSLFALKFDEDDKKAQREEVKAEIIVTHPSEIKDISKNKKSSFWKDFSELIKKHF